MTQPLSTTKPNVLVFMTDQQNGWTIKDGQRPRALTPHLDRYRKRAVSFSNAFSPSPHCCPSRASFFTGLYPSEHGVWNNVNVTNALTRGPRAETPFWSSEFVNAGYHMAFSGKWHVSNWQSPKDFGWHELMVTNGGFGSSPDLDTQRIEARVRELRAMEVDRSTVKHARIPGEVIRPGWPNYVHYGINEDPFDDALVVEKAGEFIHSRENASTPWFLYTGTLGPHDPYTPPQRFLDWYDLDDIELPENFYDCMDDKPGLYKRTRDPFDQLTVKEHRDALRHYLAFCSYEDELFGRLITALEDTNQLENTIVLFLSDHGDYAAEHGLWGKGLPAFQSAYRIPFVIGGPGIDTKHNGSETNIALSLVDIGPTLMDLCTLENGTVFSGRSLQGWLSDTQDEPVNVDLFFQSNGNEAYGIQRAVISGQWKLVYNMFDQDELYDLSHDPDEINNLLVVPPGQRLLGRNPLANIPEDLQDTVGNLYRKLWAFGIDHTDENINGYILTALAHFGPGIVSSNSSNG